MNKENGRGMIKALILLVILICIISLIVRVFNKNFNEQKSENIMSDMLLIKGACKVLNENKLRTKSEEELIGTKISNIKEPQNKEENNEETQSEEQNEDKNTENDEDVENTIIHNTIEEFIDKQIISEEEYEKYYILTDEDLQKLKVDVKNKKDAYYLINYESNEVILTKGHEGKYKLSDMEKTEEEQNSEIEVEEKSDSESEEENKE